MTEIEKILYLIDSIGNLNSSVLRKVKNLQPVHYQLLQYLSRCNRFSDTPSAVTLYLNLTKGTTSQSIKLLEREGFISKHSDPEDKRVIHLQLSAKGKIILLELEKFSNWNQVADSFNQTSLKQTRKNLESILYKYQTLNGFQSFGECHSCRHLIHQGNEYQCGLTKAPLTKADTQKICVEFQQKTTNAR